MATATIPAGKTLGFMQYLSFGLQCRFGGNWTDWEIKYCNFESNGSPSDPNQAGSVTTSLVGVTNEALQTYVDSQHNAFTLAATKTSIVANGVDEAGVSSNPLTTFNYRVYQAGAVILNGTVSDGILEFSTDAPGAYVIEIISNGNVGHITVEAV